MKAANNVHGTLPTTAAVGQTPFCMFRASELGLNMLMNNNNYKQTKCNGVLARLALNRACHCVTQCMNS